ncbi:TonB-dependent siderophore receptor [Sphingomonas flavalba]|uniref:TonB-dependent siderophore receptor n=1 Tax=Sphingomonas flavalba TaxID=2559804 RepID=UPI0039E12248
MVGAKANGRARAAAKTHRALIAALMVTTGLGAGGFGAAPARAEAQAAGFDIPAQPLATALTAFGQQSGLQVSARAPLVEGKTSRAIVGTLPPLEALSQLLAGSGLSFRVADGTVTLDRAAQAPGGGGDAILLGPVRVQGAGEGGVRHDPGTTEGTRSYTTRAMTTATKLPLSIRETPQSVTVITAQVMEDKQIEDVVDIVEHTTGLSINRYESNRGSMFSRGFKIENYLVDGIPTSINEQWSAGEISTSTAIYDRVEILRGADGLMTGVGNPSGVINLIRKHADSDSFAGSVAIEGGSRSHVGGTVDLNTPLTRSGTTRIRLVADYDKRDSYIDRMGSRTYILYGTVEQDVGERTLLSAGISHQDSHTDSPTWGGAPAWTVDGNDAVIPLGLDRDFNPSPDWAFWDSRYTAVFGRIAHDFGGGWQAKAGYSRGERDSESKIALYYSRPIDPATGQSFSLSRGTRRFLGGYAGRYFVENVKEDANLQLNGALRLFGRTHHLVFGYDYSKEMFDGDGAPGAVPQTITPNVFAFDPAITEPTYIATPNNYVDNVITRNDIYAAGRFVLLDPVSLVAGARLINYEIRDRLSATGTFGDAKSYKAKNKFLPYAALVISPFKTLSLYASYTTIFQPQGYRDISNAMLPPIEGNTYEAGIKGEFFDGRLNATLSVYRMEQKNVGQYDQIVLDEMRVAYKAVDGILSKGLEAELSGEILPKWNVTAGYSHFKARVTGPVDPLAALLGTGVAVSTLIPRDQFNLFTSYELPGGLDRLTIGGGVRWQSETYSHPAAAAAAGVPKLSQGAYLVADLLARYRITDALSAQVNVSNLFDRKYFAPTDDGMQLFWQEPRSVQLRLKYRF